MSTPSPGSSPTPSSDSSSDGSATLAKLGFLSPRRPASPPEPVEGSSHHDGPDALGASDEDTVLADPTETPDSPAHHLFRRHRLPAALLAGAVVLAAAGAWFTLETHAATTSAATTNQALTD
ncbi:MAG: hypothetical protein ACRDZY_14660, partial [Acidimicrobiales bacterium]